MNIVISLEGTKEHAKEQIEETLSAPAFKDAPNGLKAACIAALNAIPSKHFTGTINAEYGRDTMKIEFIVNYHNEDEVLKPISREHLLERATADYVEVRRDPVTGEAPSALPSHDELLQAHIQKEVKHGRRIVVKEKV